MNYGNILVVDDNLDELRILKIILEEAGYTVRPAPNGKLSMALSGPKRCKHVFRSA